MSKLESPSSPVAVSGSKIRAMVFHPGLQHAHQLALALAEHDSLMLFLCGYPLVGEETPNGRASLFKTARATAIPKRLRLDMPIFALVARLVMMTLPSRLGHRWQHLQNYLFDALASLFVLKMRPNVVVAYENSAKWIFQAGHRVGALCILDAASLHPDVGRSLMAGEGAPDPEWIDSRKRREIELADMVLCCSPFAADSYRHVVPSDRLKAVALGTALPAFVPRERRDKGQLRFVFVGPTSRRKGADLLLDVFADLQALNVSASLTFVGSVPESSFIDRIHATKNVQHHLSLPQAALFAFLRDFDCLVLPSRYDSFGMVVPECMALGLPAIVSDRVGAKCIIEDHPRAGWVVPCAMVPLRDCILGLIQNPSWIDEASSQARSAAEDYSWSSYRQRVFTVVESAYREFGHGD